MAKSLTMEPFRRILIDSPESRNVTRLGDASRHRGLCSPAMEDRREPWCASLSSCPLLPDFGVRHLGIVEADTEYRFERSEPRESIFLASLLGAGNAGSAPSISPLPAGHGVLLPRGCPRTYYNTSGNHWHLVWICFEHPCPFVTGVEGSRFAIDAPVLHHTVEALIHGWDRYRNPATTLRMIEALMDLVKLHLRIQPQMETFHHAWQRIAADLGANWNVADMSALAACSPERFRRLCWDELGTSPMKHLVRRRLGRARVLLSSTSLNIEEISGQLGYSDAYSLSHAFKREFGVSPREFRGIDRARHLQERIV